MLAFYIVRYTRACKKIQKNVRYFLACKRAKVLAVLKTWDVIEHDFLKVEERGTRSYFDFLLMILVSFFFYAVIQNDSFHYTTTPTT